MMWTMHTMSRISFGAGWWCVGLFSTMCSHQFPWFFYIFFKFPICSPTCSHYHIILSHMFCPMLCFWKFFRWANIGTYMFLCLKWIFWCCKVSKFSKKSWWTIQKSSLQYIYILHFFVGCFITILQVSNCNVDWRSTVPNLTFLGLNPTHVKSFYLFFL
jgi:hypothetical protein